MRRTPYSRVGISIFRPPLRKQQKLVTLMQIYYRDPGSYIVLVVCAKRTYGYQNLADFCSETSGLNQAWAKDSKTVEKMTRRFLLHVQLSLWFSPRGRVIYVLNPVHTIH